MNVQPSTPTVRFIAVPAELYVRNQRHVDDLVHELRIVKVGQEQGQVVPHELAETIDAILDTYAAPRDAAFTQAAAALKRGEPTVDIEVKLPAEAADAAAEAVRLLEVADGLCGSGVLLTLPADQDIRRLRRWLSTELTRQLNGEEPTPYVATQ
jgi:hypothetical protein